MPRITISGFIHETRFTADAEPQYSFFQNPVHTEYTHPVVPYLVQLDITEAEIAKAWESRITAFDQKIAELHAKGEKNYEEICRLTQAKLDLIAEHAGASA